MHTLNGGAKTLNNTHGWRLNSLSVCAHVCSGTHLFTGAEIPAAPAKSSIVEQKSSTFTQQEFQHGGESLHMSYTSVKSSTVGLLLQRIMTAGSSLKARGVFMCHRSESK